jgi:hypothetical protein
MRFDSLLVELSATPLYLLLIFLAFLLLFHVLLVWAWPLGDIAWKKVDYVWLGAAAFGVLAASAQAGREISRSYVDGVEGSRTATAYLTLRSLLDGNFGNCIPRTRAESSPADFDQIVEEQRALCAWSRDMVASMPGTLPLPYPPLEQTGFVSFGRPVRYDKEFAKAIDTSAHAYRQQQARYARLLEDARRSESEWVWNVLGPLLIALALALRITKVTGEVRNARHKAEAAA